MSRSEFYASCLEFLAEFLAQKPNTDTESEKNYNSDDSEFNYNPGYVIDAPIKHVKLEWKAYATPTRMFSASIWMNECLFPTIISNIIST